MQVARDTAQRFLGKDVGVPTEAVLLDERSAVAPDPRGEVVGNVPVVLAGEGVTTDMGSVFQNFIGGVDLADGVTETFVASDGFFSDAVFLEDSLVGEYRTDVDEPGHGIDNGVRIDMRRVPADGDEPRRLDVAEVFVQGLDFVTRGKVGNPGGTQLKNVGCFLLVRQRVRDAVPGFAPVQHLHFGRNSGLFGV